MKVSVITVNLNGDRYLAAALDSILAQDYPAVEPVVVDGGSTDGSLAIVRQAAQRSGALKLITEPDQGISDAMNKGLALATGEIVAFLHADDRYPDRDILRQVAGAFAADPAAIWLTGGIFMIDAHGESLRMIVARNYSFHRLVRSNIIFHPSTFVRRSALLDAGGFRRELRYAMDYDLWLRLGERMAPLSIARPLSCFRIHPGSHSSTAADAAFAEEQQVRLDYLRRTGRTIWPHQLWYRVKRPLNRRNYRHLLGSV